MEMQRAVRVSLSQIVLEQLLGLIRDGQLKPGDRLPSEADLCAMVGVGRSSVREAVKALAFMGLVESKPGRGSILLMRAANPIPQRNAAHALQSSAMFDLYEVRQFLEGGCAARAAERATEEEVVAIAHAAQAEEARFAAGKSAFRENDAFHLAIARAAHNQVFVESLRSLLSQIRPFRQQLTDPVPDVRQRDTAEHRAILEAIRERNPSRAQKLMVAHIAAAAHAAGLRPAPSNGRKPAGR